MRYTSSSWFPLKNFTKTGCEKDWMVGCCQWKGVKDALTGRGLKWLETVFWNRSMGNLSIGLQDYLKAREDPKMQPQLERLGLPLDIKI